MKNKILLGISIIGLIVSGILVFTNHGSANFCSPDSGCDAVQNSKYASLFGISNSIYGIFIFLILSIFAFYQINKPTKNKKRLIDSAVILGFLIVLYFIFLQAFVIKEFCKYCLIIDFSMIFAFFFIILKKDNI